MRFIPVYVVATLLLAGCASEPAPAASTDPNVDSDGDGFSDVLEVKFGSDAFNATSVPDVRVHEDVTFNGGGLIVGGIEDVVGGAGCGGVQDRDTVVLTWLIEAPAGATSVYASGLTFTATYPITMAEGDIYVFDPEGKQLTDSTGSSIPPSPTDTVTADGQHPAGEYRIEVRGCLGAGQIELAASGVLSYLPDPATLI